MNGIATSELTKAYTSQTAVNGLTINVNAGEIFGFLGPNGAGKTTTIRILCGLMRPTSGKAEVAGYDISTDSLKIRRVIGLLPESSGFYNWMTPQEYMLHFAALYRIESKEAKRRVGELLERFGLADRSSVPIGYYSCGMKQKVGLARALINEPRILFLDEPTLGLDPRGQQEIRRIILELHEKGVTVFLSSHALSEVSSICQRVAIVNKGRLVAEGTLRELREHAGDKGTILVRIVNSDRIEQQLSHLPFQVDVNSQGDYLDVTVPESATDFIHTFEKAGVEIYEIHRNEMTLEQVFFNLTEITQAVATDPVKGERM